MSAQLIPFDVSGIKATYTAATRILLVTAEGFVPSKVIGPMFVRDDDAMLGSAPPKMLRVVSNFGGRGANQPDRLVNFQYTEDLAPGFKSKTVTIITAASWTSSREVEKYVPIVMSSSGGGGGPKPNPNPTPTPIPAPVVITPLKPLPLPKLPLRDDSKTVALPSIAISLPPGNFVRVTAPIPDATLCRYSVEARSDTENLYVWRGGETPGTLYWDVLRADVISSSKGTFTVTTSFGTKGVSGQADGPMQATAQAYIFTVAK
jgi:hypothetical protein